MSISSLGMALKVPALGSGQLDPDTTAYLANITAAGGTISANSLDAVDRLVKGLKADGLWPLLHEIYTFSGDFAAALVKLKTITGQNTLTNHNFVSGDYSEASGLTGNGSSKYLQTGYIPSTYATLNSTSIGAWNPGNTTSSPSFAFACQNDSANRLAISAPSGGTARVISDLYDVSNGRLSTNISTTPFEFLSSTRRSATDHEAYQNGISLGSNSTSGGTLPIYEAYCFAINNAGSPLSYSDHTYSLILAGLGLSTSQMLNLYNRLLTFQQAIGRA
jgi:hypothetical protein